MIRKSQYFSNLYRDSVALMQLSAALLDVEGVVQASLVMATEANIDLLAEVGLVDAETAPRPNDILFAIEAEDDAAHAAALAAAEGMLAEDKPAPGGGGVPEFPPRSFEMALEAMPAANLALISCPGEYAAAEGMKALRLATIGSRTRCVSNRWPTPLTTSSWGPIAARPSSAACRWDSRTLSHGVILGSWRPPAPDCSRFRA